MPLAPIIGSLIFAVAVFLIIFQIFDTGASNSSAGRANVGPEPPASLMQYIAPSSKQVRDVLQKFGGQKLDKSRSGNEITTKLSQADIKLRPVEWIAAVCGLSLVLGLLLFSRFDNPIGGLIGIIAGFVGSQLYLKIRTTRRRRNFERQLGPAVKSMSNGLKAGYTLAQAVDLVAQNASSPMDYELRRVIRETQLGLPIQEALVHMVNRNRSEDLKLMVTAVQIQTQVGGNLAQILDLIEFTIRERVRIKGEIRSLTGQARASGYVLLVLPFALAGVLELIAPSYFGPMVSDSLGQITLVVTTFIMLCGYLIIRKIVGIKI